MFNKNETEEIIITKRKMLTEEVAMFLSSLTKKHRVCEQEESLAHSRLTTDIPSNAITKRSSDSIEEYFCTKKSAKISLNSAPKNKLPVATMHNSSLKNKMKNVITNGLALVLISNVPTIIKKKNYTIINKETVKRVKVVNTNPVKASKPTKCKNGKVTLKRKVAIKKPNVVLPIAKENPAKRIKKKKVACASKTKKHVLLLNNPDNNPQLVDLINTTSVFTFDIGHLDSYESFVTHIPDYEKLFVFNINDSPNQKKIEKNKIKK